MESIEDLVRAARRPGPRRPRRRLTKPSRNLGRFESCKDRARSRRRRGRRRSWREEAAHERAVALSKVDDDDAALNKS